MLSMKRPGSRLAVGAVLVLGLLGWLHRPLRRRTAPEDAQERGRRNQEVLLFAADGLRQDLVEEYASKRRGAQFPASPSCCAAGPSARGSGMLTRAPTNTGAGWYTMATGAWPGVHGSTNNTFHANSHPSATGRQHSTPGVLRPRRSPSPPSAAARRSFRWSGRAAVLA